MLNTTFLSLYSPCLASSRTDLPLHSNCTASALEVVLSASVKVSMPRGNWGTAISGKAPPSPKSLVSWIQPDVSHKEGTNILEGDEGRLRRSHPHSSRLLSPHHIRRIGKITVSNMSII